MLVLQLRAAAGGRAALHPAAGPAILPGARS